MVYKSKTIEGSRTKEVRKQSKIPDSILQFTPTNLSKKKYDLFYIGKSKVIKFRNNLNNQALNICTVALCVSIL
jgi:hypothetical protein